MTDRRHAWSQWIGTTPTGPVSARLHGVKNILRERAASARREARVEGRDQRFAAALRGKAIGYDEAVDLLDKLDRGRPLRARRFWRVHR